MSNKEKKQINKISFLKTFQRTPKLNIIILERRERKHLEKID